MIRRGCLEHLHALSIYFMPKPQTTVNVGRMWASSTQEGSSTRGSCPQEEMGSCLEVPRSEQRDTSGWHPGVGGVILLPAILHLVLQLPRYPRGPQTWPNPPIQGYPPSGPTPHPPHTQTKVFITKSFFIEDWVRDRNRECTGGHTPVGRGVRCWLAPCLL